MGWITILEHEAKEREEMIKADSESRGYEREVKYQNEEKERREWEQNHIQQLEEELNKSSKEWKSRLEQQMNWKKMIGASRKVNPLVEAELNTWINLWTEQEELTLENTLKQCQEAENVSNSTYALITRDHKGIDYQGKDLDLATIGISKDRPNYSLHHTSNKLCN